jgi:hypothetical protein
MHFVQIAYIWVEFDSQNKQRLFPQTAFKKLIVVIKKYCVFSEIRAIFLHIILMNIAVENVNVLCNGSSLLRQHTERNGPSRCAPSDKQTVSTLNDPWLLVQKHTDEFNIRSQRNPLTARYAVKFSRINRTSRCTTRMQEERTKRSVTATKAQRGGMAKCRAT